MTRCNIRDLAEQNGYEVKLPATDPHGRAWYDLEDSDLAQVASWCMLPAHHEALRVEFARRKALDPLSRAMEDRARQARRVYREGGIFLLDEVDSSHPALAECPYGHDECENPTAPVGQGAHTDCIVALDKQDQQNPYGHQRGVHA